MQPTDWLRSFVADLSLPLISLAILSCNSTALAQVSGAAPGFSLAAKLAHVRAAHTSTLLADGRVLVAGGGQGPDMIDGFWVVSDAELFDPASASFAPAGSLARDLHTATLLQSGQVLMVGGEVGWAGFSPIVSQTADLYDPITGSLQPTGRMTVPRESHTATLLLDGRVLVAGGARLKGINWESLPFAEIYDPATGTFSTTGNMNEARYGHTATLLADGKVLITGGFNTGNLRALASAEIYDPVTASFTLTGSMSFERSSPAATLLLDGKVLVTGDSAIAEVYDPAVGSFQSVGAMVTPRRFHTATLLTNGTVLIVGGFADLRALSSAELYDPTAGSFTRTANLNAGRLWHTATLLSDGSVLVIGGAGTMSDLKLTFVDSAEIYKKNSRRRP